MFTGIIEELGIVTLIIRDSSLFKLTVGANKVMEGMKIGDSISVNGVCLTVNSVERKSFSFDVSEETIKDSMLSSLKIGDKVNLERALPVSGRVGGHIVTGHVDGVGTIKHKNQVRVKDGTTFSFEIEASPDLLKYLAIKGSIAVDGISLTIADLRMNTIVIAIVPHTAKITTLAFKNIGDRVNLEVDILSKYIERHLKAEAPSVTEQVMLDSGFFPIGVVNNN